MIELSNERVEKILHEETLKTEDLKTILRGIFTRYRRLFEKYFADIDSLNDDEIAELKEYHEETRSLVMCYYLDIPLDIVVALKEFDDKYTSRLLGPERHKYLSDTYKEFVSEYEGEKKSEESLKAEFVNDNLDFFYDLMDEIFRESFGTRSETADKLANGFAGMLFGE